MKDAALFGGATFVPARDAGRLTAQIHRVMALMEDQEWRTLAGISAITGYPTPSVSARLRDLRKPRYGRFVVERKYVAHGLFEYRVLPSQEIA